MKIHMWTNSDCRGLRFYKLSKQYKISNHVRHRSLQFYHINQMIHAMLEPNNKPEVHVLILTNEDVSVSNNVTAYAIELCRKVSILKKHLIFVCIDLLKGKNFFIKLVKRQIRKVADEDNFAHLLHDVGQDLRSGDFISRSRLTLPASKRIEDEINLIVEDAIRYM